MTFLTAKGTSRMQRFTVSSRYKQLQDNNLGHSLEGAPFVGAALRRTKPGWCQISARYINQEGLEIVWTVNTPVRLCFKLDWDRLSSDSLRQIPRGGSEIIPPPPSADSIIELRVDMPEEGSYDLQDIPTTRVSKSCAFTVLKELILVGFERRLHLLPFFKDNCTALEKLHLEGEHGVQDLHGTLKGCLKLQKLFVSTITHGLETMQEELEHETLQDLTLVSDIAVPLVFKGLRFSKLTTLRLWVMPGLACDGPVVPVEVAQSLLQGEGIRKLGLNAGVSQDYKDDLQRANVTFIPLI